VFRDYNLLMAGLWLLLAVLLLAPEDAIAPQLVRHLGGPLKTPAGVLAVVLTAYNLVRWWSYRALLRNRAAPARNPLAVRKTDPDAEERYEPNPELDFFKVTDPDHPGPPPEPSANGDHK
jgi:hypothetical protein